MNQKRVEEKPDKKQGGQFLCSSTLWEHQKQTCDDLRVNSDKSGLKHFCLA